MKEIEALKACLDPMCTVKRSGKTHPRASSELVPGDIVTLRAGAAVPADCRLYPGEMKDTKNTKPIYVDCSALTGESLPVKKGRGDQVLLSTTVVRGEADAIVVATGARTECGQTQQLMDAVDEPSNFDKVLQKMLIILISTGLLVNLVIIIYVSAATLVHVCLPPSLSVCLPLLCFRLIPCVLRIIHSFIHSLPLSTADGSNPSRHHGNARLQHCAPHRFYSHSPSCCVCLHPGLRVSRAGCRGGNRVPLERH